MMMRRRTKGIAALVLLAAFVMLMAEPMHGIVVHDAPAFGQRITMLAQQLTTIRRLRDQLGEMRSQLSHMRDEAMGRVGALQETFGSLSAEPTQLLGETVGWAGDFKGESRDVHGALLGMGQPGPSLVNHWRRELARADKVGDADLAAAFQSSPEHTAEAVIGAWRGQDEMNERARVLDFAAFEAAERLAEVLESAQGALEGQRGQRNLSTTALAQAQVAAQLTNGEVNVALAQLAAYTTIREGMERQTAELARRRALERWTARQADWQVRLERIQTANAGRRDAYRTGLMLPVKHGR